MVIVWASLLLQRVRATAWSARWTRPAELSNATRTSARVATDSSCPTRPASVSIVYRCIIQRFWWRQLCAKRSAVHGVGTISTLRGRAGTLKEMRELQKLFFVSRFSLWCPFLRYSMCRDNRLWLIVIPSDIVIN